MKSRILLVLVVLSGVFYVFALRQLRDNSHQGKTDLRVPDLQFAPSGNYIHQFLVEIDPIGRKEYRAQSIHEDFIYPLAYTSLFGLLLIYIANRMRTRKWVYYLSLFFVIGMLFDWTENTIMVWIIDAWPKEIYDYYSMYAIASGVKWTSLGVGMLSVGILMLLAAKNLLLQSKTRN